MIHVAPISEDNLADIEAITETETYLNEHGYSVNGGKYYAVVNQKPDGENSGYVVQESTTTAVPFDDADVVSDTIEIYLCSCGAYRYQQGVESLEERDTLEWRACKHISKIPAYKAKRASNDDSQVTL